MDTLPRQAVLIPDRLHGHALVEVLLGHLYGAPGLPVFADLPLDWRLAHHVPVFLYFVFHTFLM